MSTTADPGAPPASRRTYFAREQPRRIADGVWWLGSCSDTGGWGGKWAQEAERRHVHTNAYLVVGAERSLLVESGHSAVWPGLVRQLERVLGGRRLDYVLPTHQELPHCGNLGRLAHHWPGMTIVGDVSDYLLYFPSLDAGQLRATPPGTVLDLGGLHVEVLEAVWHDLRTTLWAFAREPAVLFCVDGLQFSHEHASGDCGRVSSELATVPSGALVEIPARDTIKWARYTDLSAQAGQFVALAERLRPAVLAPTHGAPIVGGADAVADSVLEATARVGRELRASSSSSAVAARDTGA